MKKKLNQLLIKIAKKNDNIYNKFIQVIFTYNFINQSILLRILLLMYISIKYIIKKDSFHNVNIKQLQFEDTLNQLKNYDIISFDIFDTLIFRPFTSPEHVFDILSHQNNTPCFIYNRKHAEKKAIKLLHKIPNIYELYKYVDNQPQNEINLETDICYSNQFMLKIYSELKKINKTIIATSDMYLPKNVINNILSKCGYKDFSDIYTSCDLNLSKSNGNIYNHIKSTYGIDKSYIHVGDNYLSDFINAKKYGFHAIYYPNINLSGLYNRPIIIDNIYTSITNALSNYVRYSGNEIYNKYFEFGYAYIGMFLCGLINRLYDLKTKYNTYNIVCINDKIYNIITIVLDLSITRNISDNCIIFDKYNNKNTDAKHIFLCKNKKEHFILNLLTEDKNIYHGATDFVKTHYHSFNKYGIFKYKSYQYLDQIIKQYKYIKMKYI